MDINVVYVYARLSVQESLYISIYKTLLKKEWWVFIYFFCKYVYKD